MLTEKFLIGETEVGRDSSPYIIAEAGSNFNQDLDTAFRLIDAAATAGADAVKFQLFRADFLYPDKGELYDIFKSIELNPDWVPRLSEYAGSKGVHFMASAFDRESVDVLESVNVPAHKIASSETTKLDFLHYVASKGKPVLLSTGMCDLVDVQEAINVCHGAGNRNLALLQCGAMYPLPQEYVNLRVIETFLALFGSPAGFSDHTLGIAASIAAVGLGATVFEKHFTLDRNSEGPDHFYALEPEDLAQYVAGIREAHASLGSCDKRMLPSERELGRREGLYISTDLKSGHRLTTSDITIKRPAVGLRARYATVVEGAVLKRDLAKDSPLHWSDIQF